MDKINKKIIQKSELNQQTNTDVVIDWFKQTKNKNFYKFATFDIKELFSSTKECLLKNAINFAEEHTKISEKGKTIIFHARKSLLFNGQHVWIKKQGGKYRSFCKTNNEITYIHIEPNHPPSILRQIPLSIKSRLSKHSSNEKIFKESTNLSRSPKQILT